MMRGHFQRHGRDVWLLLLPSNCGLAHLSSSDLFKLGLVRQAEVDRAVLEEREACAEIAQRTGFDSAGARSQHVARLIRARSAVAS